MKILIFGGTTEGRWLAADLMRENEVTVSTATALGAELNPSGVNTVCGRLGVREMSELMRDFNRVIDATHPFAAEASENISRAAKIAGKKYERIQREVEHYNGEVFGSYEEIIDVLNSCGGDALITTGSNALDKYTRVRDYQSRLWIRILPARESMERAWELGFKPQRIIAAQGRFSEEMNIALIKHTGAELLVTKNSGAAGGFYEKVRAAEKTGIRLLVYEKGAEKEK